jgi:hypothetical protein
VCAIEENTHRDLVPFRQEVFDADVQVAEATAEVADEGLHRSGSANFDLTVAQSMRDAIRRE